MAMSYLSWRLLILCLLATDGMAYIAMNWNSSYYFGPDGPWQAVTLGVQNNRTTEIRTVNLLPADNLGYTFIPTSNLCELPNTNEYCGVGGTVDYPSSFANSTSWADRDDFFVSGVVSTAMVNSGTQRASDVTIIAMTNSSSSGIRYPAGDKSGVELGFFYKGGSGSNPLCPGIGCDFTTALHNAGQITSLSYGMHIGSASLDYGGSLILGGLDKARIAGPVMKAITGSINAYGTMDPNNFRLQDIVIGVETGESPFSFRNKTGLLSGQGTASAQSLPVILDSSTAYIGLPEQAASSIASALPVSLDSDTGYYLWNASDPLYNSIVTSPSYLGFALAGLSSESPSSITIKVPFRLLNLTLEPRASGLDRSVPYLPIRVLERSDYEFYSLGRAFLQAAFMGEDFSSNSTWIAQAPGPGGRDADVVNFGQGTSMRTMESDAETFADSWAAHWTPLAQVKPPAESQPEADGLSGGEIAGIVVGAVAGITIVALTLLYLRRKRRAKQSIAPGEKSPPVELQGDMHRAELQGSTRAEWTKFDTGVERPRPHELVGSPAR